MLLYIKADQVIEVLEPQVKLGTLIQMECRNQVILNKLKAMVIIKFKKYEYKRTVISILKVIEEIHQLYPDIQIVNLGALDIIVAYEAQKSSNNTFHILKAIVVSSIAFIGSAYSIMAFSNDVDTLDIFDLIYELVTGQNSVGVNTLEVSYCIGLILGIVIFFNHFGSKKMTVDPTPMEVEMRLYEQDIQTTLIQNFSRRGEEIDMGDTGIVNHNRNQ